MRHPRPPLRGRSRPAGVPGGLLWAALLAPALMMAAGCDTGPPPDAPAAPGRSPASASPGQLTPSGAPATPASPAPASRPAPAGAGARYVFPVSAPSPSFGRTHAGYPASDIFAPCGSPVRAATDGVVLEVNRVDRYDPARPVPADRGGLSVSLLGDDGVRYYGSHLTRIASGIDSGVRVRAGRRLGDVGFTGRASGVCHLHFGVSPPCAGVGDWWIRRGVVWPARFLTAWRAGEALSPAPTVAAWQRAHGCPASPSAPDGRG